MKVIKLIAALLAIMPLTGCVGNEPNNAVYIVAMGFDKAKDGSDNYEMTIQFAKPTEISGGASESGGKGGSDIIENIVVNAPSIYAGINTANHIVSKKFSLFHSKLFVFSSEVAQEGIADLLETMSRSEEIRADVYMAVSRGRANEYLTEVKPVVELNPAKYYQLTYDENDADGFPRCTLLEFAFLENVDYADIAVPVAGVMDGGSVEENGEKLQDEESSDSGGNNKKSDDSNSQNENSEEKNVPLNESGFEFKIKNYIAGQVAVQEENRSETMGMGIFRNEKLVAILGEKESVLYNILRGNYRSSYVTFREKQDSDKPVTLKIAQRKRPMIKIDKDNKKVRIRLYLEADFYSVSADYNIEKHIAEFEGETKKEINSACEEFIKSVRDNYDSDIVGIGLEAKKLFWTNKEFEEYNWRKKFSEYDISVDTDFKIRRTGLTMREKE